MKGLGQNITIEHLKKNDDSHDGYEYDQDPASTLADNHQA